MTARLETPSETCPERLFFDTRFRQKRKHRQWREVEPPPVEGPVADTHCHLQLLSHPALALARSAFYGVSFLCTIVDVIEDGSVTFDELDDWRFRAHDYLKQFGAPAVSAPTVSIACGCHPHNAKEYDEERDSLLIERLKDSRVCALGEIGLDYHYDFSPRPVQRDVFRRQIQVAKELNLPVILHLREAHDDGFGILAEEGFPEAGVLLHCYNLGASELVRWIEAGCYVAFGGPVTFKKADEVREAAQAVPLNRLLTETDSPYMAPEPLRGVPCGPDFVIFTADKLAHVRGIEGAANRGAFFRQLYSNALDLLGKTSGE